MLNKHSKYILLSLVLLTLLFTIGFSTLYSVETYTIEEVTDDSITITANFSTPVFTPILGTTNNGNTTILTTDLLSNSFTYQISPNTSRKNRHQFITDENIYIHDYVTAITIRDIGIKRLPGKTLNSTSSTYTAKSSGFGLVIYKIPTITETQTKHNITTSITYSQEITNPTKMFTSIHKMSKRFDFNTEKQLDLYIVERPPQMRFSGYISTYNRKHTETSWVAERYNTFNSEQLLMHEIVHLHQDHQVSPKLKWFKEGSASYIAEVEYIQWQAETNSLDSVYISLNNNWYSQTDSQYNTIKNVKLSSPNTWEQSIQYERGKIVAYLIDYSLKYHTNGETTLIDIIEWMNTKETVTYDEFRSKIVSHTDEKFGKQLDTYIGPHNPINIDKQEEKISGQTNYTIKTQQNYPITP